jgi:hypothetical protein
MSSQAVRILPIVLQSIAYTSLSSSFVAFGAKVGFPLSIIKIQNTSDVAVYISWDGTHIHDVVPGNAGMVLDLTANKSVEHGIFISAQTIFYAKSVSGTPTYGAVYLSAFYGQD